jgi:hypothetical protein
MTQNNKHGFIHIHHLPKGYCGNWSVIHNVTKTHFVHPEETKDISYHIWWADDLTQIVGGVVVDKNEPLNWQPWSMKANFYLEYTEPKKGGITMKEMIEMHEKQKVEKDPDEKWEKELAKMKDSLERTIKAINDETTRNAELNKLLSSIIPDSFATKLFQIAKDTNQSFDDTCKAAEILCQQGLSSEEVLSRLNAALILSKLARVDMTLEESAKNLSSAIEAFRNGE